MFRKLYWIVEQVDECGCSRVKGVFTSIPNLMKEGLTGGNLETMRLTLTKLDEVDGIVGSWTGPSFPGLSEMLSELAQTDMFSPEQCGALIAALK